MRMRRRATFASAFALLAFACNALTGASDLSVGGDPRDPTADGAVDSTAATDGGSSSEGTLDGGDASVVVVDDAATDADAMPLGFCASRSPAPTLCNDFEDDATAPWTVTPGGAGTVTIETTQSRSAPRSLRVAVPAASSGRAFIARTFAGALPATITIAFAVRAEAVATDTTQELAVIFLATSGGNPYQLQLEMRSNGMLELEEETPLPDATIPERNVDVGISLPFDEWRRVTWTVAIGASSSTSTVAVEGVANPSQLAVSAHAYKAAPTINIGHDGTVATPFSVFYDDLVVDLK